MLKKFIFATALLFAPTLGFAAQMHAYGGLNSTEFDGDGNWDRDLGLDFGVLYMHPVQQDLWVRTGVGIAQRHSEIDLGLADESVEFMLLEVPVTAYFQLNNKWALFGGLTFNIVLDDDDVTGSKSIVFNLPVGFRVNISGPHAIEGFIEMGVTDLASSGNADFKVGNVIGAKYLYAFDL